MTAEELELRAKAGYEEAMRQWVLRQSWEDAPEHVRDHWHRVAKAILAGPAPTSRSVSEFTRQQTEMDGRQPDYDRIEAMLAAERKAMATDPKYLPKLAADMSEMYGQIDAVAGLTAQQADGPGERTLAAECEYLRLLTEDQRVQLDSAKEQYTSLRCDLFSAQAHVKGLAERVAAQSELLSKRAAANTKLLQQIELPPPANDEKANLERFKAAIEGGCEMQEKNHAEVAELKERFAPTDVPIIVTAGGGLVTVPSPNKLPDDRLTGSLYQSIGGNNKLNLSFRGQTVTLWVDDEDYDMLQKTGWFEEKT